MRRFFIQLICITVLILGVCKHVSAAELLFNVNSNTLEISSDEPGTIHYTINGSKPSVDSYIYNGPLSFDIPTVVTAQLFLNGEAVSEPLVRTMSLPKSVNLPIVSLAIDPEDFYSREKGIYANPEERGKPWERKAHMEIFSKGSPELLTKSGVGLRIHGGASRKRGAKKSIRLYFKDKYGNGSFTYPFFGVREAYKRLILRAGFNDSWNYDKDLGRNSQKRTATYISDQIARDLHAEMGQRVSRGRFVVLYINGKYFGLYNLVNRLDEYFMAGSTETDEFATVVSSDEVKGSGGNSWRALINFVKRSYEDENFLEELETMMDVDSFISYMFLNIYLQNYDWPKHNWIAGQGEVGAPWKFYAWDTEYSFGSGSRGYTTRQNTLSTALNAPGTLGELFNHAYKNTQFKNRFTKAAHLYMENNLKADHIKAKIDKYSALIRPYMAKEARTWAPDMSVGVWNRALKLAKDFCDRRASFVKSIIGRVSTSDRQITCASKDFELERCYIGRSVKDVRLFEQLSSSRCIRGYSWGFKGDHIWVDRGCRASFEYNLAN